jgi:hypothetical protein
VAIFRNIGIIGILRADVNDHSRTAKERVVLEPHERAKHWYKARRGLISQQRHGNACRN